MNIYNVVRPKNSCSVNAEYSDGFVKVVISCNFWSIATSLYIIFMVICGILTLPLALCHNFVNSFPYTFMLSGFIRCMSDWELLQGLGRSAGQLMLSFPRNPSHHKVTRHRIRQSCRHCRRHFETAVANQFRNGTIYYTAW